MSQTDLSQFDAPREETEQTDDRPNWEPQSSASPDLNIRVECPQCGNQVTQQFARVFGDNDDELINGCLECATYREIGGGQL